MKKIAIVTGASGGIGGSIANRLAKDGFLVVVNYAGKPAPAQVVVADLKAAGGQGVAEQADVANAEDVERLFKESMDAFGRPDVVVHCAGIMPLFPIASGDVATFDKVIATKIAKVVDAPFGKRPFRVHLDPTKDGADVAFAVMDRVRTEMLHRVGLSELLTPAGAESRTASNA